MKGEIFCTPSDRPWGPPNLLYNGYRVFPGGKRPRRGVDHPPTSRAEVEGRVELYLHSPSGSSWPVIGCHLPLPIKSELEGMKVSHNTQPKNALYCSLDIYITISHRIFLHVSTHKGLPSRNQTKAIPYKNKLAPFIQT